MLRQEFSYYTLRNKVSVLKYFILTLLFMLGTKSVHRISAKPNPNRSQPHGKEYTQGIFTFKGRRENNFDIHQFLKIRYEIKLQFKFYNICLDSIIEFFFKNYHVNHTLRNKVKTKKVYAFQFGIPLFQSLLSRFRYGTLKLEISVQNYHYLHYTG